MLAAAIPGMSELLAASAPGSCMSELLAGGLTSPISSQDDSAIAGNKNTTKFKELIFR